MSIVQANQEIDEELVQRIEEAGMERIKIRSVLDLPVEARCLYHVLRSRPRARSYGQSRRGDRRYRRTIDR